MNYFKDLTIDDTDNFVLMDDDTAEVDYLHPSNDDDYRTYESDSEFTY